MESIQNVLSILLVVFTYIVFVGIFMRVAGYIGEKIGFAKIFQGIWQWIRRKLKTLKYGKE